jgi:N6-adenosine-specific RNA methylase IME4
MSLAAERPDSVTVSPEMWAARITAAWQRSAESILETGRLLIEAKAALPHGEWLPLLKLVGFPRRKAQRLMAIAGDKRFAETSILTLLPDEWTSVHALHKIDCDVPKLVEYLQNPQLVKAEKREAKEYLLGQKQIALSQQKFGVIYTDPPWRFEPYSRETGMDRAADNQYPTSDVERIAQICDVTVIAADDCVLFMWATVPLLTDALWLLNRYGFTYRSHYIWVKTRGDCLALGTGYWNRNAHEILLIGTKGKIPAPVPGTQHPSVVMAPLGKHSAKPDFFAEMIEGYYPTLPKTELFRRGPARPGWVPWGNEAEQPAEAAE